MADRILVYVGTYTKKEAQVEGKSQGIHIYDLDLSSGALAPVSVTTGIVNPTFLDIDKDQKFLYSVSEVAESGGDPSGAITAFRIDSGTGELTTLNHRSSMGPGPCHLSVDASGKFVLVANYSGGSVSILPIEEDGSLGEASDFIQHEGSSVNPGRQTEPHAHSITLDPGNRYAYSADLGIDKVLIYRIDFENGNLIPNPPHGETAPGAGPRHFVFHPNRKFGYVINELDNTVTIFAYDEDSGSLETIGAKSTIPNDFDGTTYCADIHILSSGRFLYGTNRGHDSLVIFEVDSESGMLTTVDYESTQGEFPRNFAIDPTETFLLAANQNTDNIVSYRIDHDSGRLTPTGHITEVPTPVCIKMTRT